MREQMQRLSELMEQFDHQADPAAQAAMSDIVRTLLEMHTAGLRQMMERLNRDGQRGLEVMRALLSDDAFSGLLILHDLHPDDLPTRVERALDRARPYLASHGGHAEVVSISEGGEVTLRLHGSCHGCPSSRVTLRSLIEKEIYSAAPDAGAIVVEGLTEPDPQPSEFVPLDRLEIHRIGVQATAS